MKRIFIFLIFLSNIGTNIIAQEKTETKCSIRILNDQTEKSVKKYLAKQSLLINILVSKDCKFLNDSLFQSIHQTDSNKNKEICEKILQTTDSIIVILDNGITWNLNSAPPKQPKRFYSKMFSKKWSDNQEVIDRISYLEFCSQFDNSNDNPCKVTDTYKVYTQIKYKENTIFKAVYEIDLKTKPKQFDILSLTEFQNGLEVIIEESTKR